MGEPKVLWTHNFSPAPNGRLFIDVTAAAIRPHGVEVELLYLGNLRSPGSLMRARAAVRRAAGAFDIVHAQYGSACGLATSAARGVKKVLSIRGNDWAVHDERFGFHYVHTRLARRMTRVSLKHFDLVLAMSNRAADEIRQVSPGSRVETLPTPIDLNTFVVRDRAEARARFGFPSSSEKWVFFNALSLDDPIKRYSLAKAAFDLANSRIGNLRFRVATGVPHDEVPWLVAACDLILCTSETEGWPNSVKEALACNVPFVSTDVSDLSQIAAIEPSCRVCPPDAPALAEAMCEVLSSPPPAGLRRHVQHMDIDPSGRRLADLYRSLM